MYVCILNRYVKVSQRDLIKAWGLPQGNFYNIPKSQIKSESSLAFPSHQLSQSPQRIQRPWCRKETTGSTQK